MIVEEIMTENPVAVEETTSIGEAFRALSELEVRHLPVVRRTGSGSELVGMVSDRDFRELGLSLIADLEDLDRARALSVPAVSTLMASDVLSTGPNTDVGEVIDVLVEEKVGALPVIDETTGDLVGIVSYIDVLRVARDIV